MQLNLFEKLLNNRESGLANLSSALGADQKQIPAAKFKNLMENQN